MKAPCVLTIAGSDSGGGAGIAADLKTFAALGVHGLCVVTAVTAQNTRGVDATFELPPEFVIQQLDTVMRDFDVEWAKTGMLSNVGIIRAVDAGAKRYGLSLVVDPVMVAATGVSLLREDAVAALVKLLARAELVTPNVFEAEKLSGIRIRSRADMEMAARAIVKLGPHAVLVKGGHLKGRVVVDLLYSGGKIKEFRGQRLAGGPAHGTGCSFASAITAELAKGASLDDAITKAKKFVEAAIESRLHVGKGVSPVNQMAALLLNAEKSRALEEVWLAAQQLASDPKFVQLLPEVGSNIVMALPNATKASDVVGLSGRIVRSGGRVHVAGFPVFGGSEHVANIVLTAMRHDQKIRAAMNVKFSHDILRACKDLGLSVGTFDRGREPKGVKTMVWGIEQAIKNAGRVPQVIYDKGAPGKEAMIRLLGASPLEISEVALRLATEIGRKRKDF